MWWGVKYIIPKSSILWVAPVLAALCGCGTATNVNARNDLGTTCAADLQDEPFVSASGGLVAGLITAQMNREIAEKNTARRQAVRAHQPQGCPPDGPLVIRGDNDRQAQNQLQDLQGQVRDWQQQQIQQQQFRDQQDWLRDQQQQMRNQQEWLSDMIDATQPRETLNKVGARDGLTAEA